LEHFGLKLQSLWLEKNHFGKITEKIKNSIANNLFCQ